MEYVLHIETISYERFYCVEVAIKKYTCTSWREEYWEGSWPPAGPRDGASQSLQVKKIILMSIAII